MKELRESFFRTLRVPQYAGLWAYSLFRANPIIWDLLNRSGKSLYKKNPPNLNQVQSTVLNGLLQNGIAMVSIDDLFPDEDVLLTLIKFIELHKNEAIMGVKKPFLRHIGGNLWRETSTIDLDNPFIQTSLKSTILDIVNSYIGVCSKLIYYEIALTNLMNKGERAMVSQRWHRDPGMKRMVKVFIYLTDVEEESGPFTYVLQSHAGGRWRRLFPQKQFGRRGMYPPEGAVDEVVPKTDIRVCTGRTGTVIFCDTTGLHKGGYSLSKPRSMSTSVYVAEGDMTKRKFKYPTDFKEQISTLSAVSRFAVT